MFNYDITFFPY